MLFGHDGGKMIRTAVFFDGGFFDEVGKYYKFQHERGSRLSIEGIQEFVKVKTAELEQVDQRYCHIVESHYFRGRFSATSAAAANKLEEERRFDEILMRAGVVQHYLPIDESGPRPSEKGIDVWLSLEAFDLAVHKRFDVLALLGCDGDYVPLVRKLNGIGTRVMLLYWDFCYEFDVTDRTTGQPAKRRKETRTSSRLIEVATYPIHMNAVIDDRSNRGERLIDDLFVNG